MIKPLDGRSERALAGVHPDLQRVVRRAAEGPLRFIVTEGLRSKERQVELVASGKSRTMRSRHLTGHAVDLAVLLSDGKVSWERAAYRFLSMSVKAAAAELGVPIEWGGEAFGPSFFDGPHFQLPWATHPGGEELVGDEGRTTA